MFVKNLRNVDFFVGHESRTFESSTVCVIVDLDYCECRYYFYCVPEHGSCHSYCPVDTGCPSNNATLFMEVITGTVCIVWGYVYDLCTKLQLTLVPIYHRQINSRSKFLMQ
jgi:hypothetical protein